MKEKLLNITIYVTCTMALLQLVLSQMHISVITKVFATDVGFYFFLFIIFGLVTVFNMKNVKQSNNSILLIICSAIAIVVGIKYIHILLDDVSQGKLLTYNDIVVSLYNVIASIIIYGVGTITVVITKRKLNSK
ncbi:hypothetical protein SH1V18_19000 [Vallitalea longa]|uniref:Uncharacterized protein n=1 Tax=Vallitalea longa TaxID=2936439 RepID=A0A9W5YB82_9FIRM|nr:hypothetical protein [Vallitalea longa]GKX29420.1 hypothetical protein SH1V18_19000 [Vallitalea longa]